MEPQRTLSGIDIYRALAAIGMAVVHAHIFVARGADEYMRDQPRLWQDLTLLLGFFSLSIPALAGAALRTNLDKYLFQGKLLNYNSRDLWSAVFFLMFIESFKNSMLFGINHVFQWDALHFIALSFLVITVALRKSSLLLLPLLAISIPTNHFLPMMLESEIGVETLIFLRKLSPLFLKSVPVVTAIYLIYKAFTNQRLRRNQKVSISLTLLALSSIASVLIHQLQKSDFFAQTTIATLLPAAFIPTSSSTHMWPLMPWISLLIVGFLLSDFLKSSKATLKLQLALFGASTAVFTTFFLFFYNDYRAILSKGGYFSIALFSAPASVMIGLLSFYTALFLLLNLIFEKVEFKNAVAYNLSRGILFFYIIHFALAFWLRNIALNILGVRLSIELYPITIIILSYVILRMALKIIDNPIMIRFKKRF